MLPFIWAHIIPAAMVSSISSKRHIYFLVASRNCRLHYIGIPPIPYQSMRSCGKQLRKLEKLAIVCIGPEIAVNNMIELSIGGVF